MGDGEYEIEAGVIAQKVFGAYTFVWNGIVEAEWEKEDGEWEDSGKLVQNLALQRNLQGDWLVGLELIHETGIEDWDEFEDSVVYFGPNLAVNNEKYWFVVAPVFQLTDEEAPEYMTSFVFGMEF